MFNFAASLVLVVISVVILVTDGGSVMARSKIS